MRILNFVAGAASLALLASGPALAGQHGNSGSHGPTTHVTPSHPTPSSNAGPKSTTHGPASTGSTHGGGSSAHGPKSDSSGASAHNGSEHSPKKNATSTTTTTTTTTSTLTATDFASTAVGQKLTRNTALQSKLTTELKALGYTGTVFEGAYGFKNLGQFVAAVNVSRNLGIPFEQLKLQMTGLTVNASGQVTQSNTPTKSLGQSIQTLKPGADAEAAAEQATDEAEVETETSTKTTTSTSTKPGKKKS